MNPRRRSDFQVVKAIDAGAVPGLVCNWHRAIWSFVKLFTRYCFNEIYDIILRSARVCGKIIGKGRKSILPLHARWMVQAGALRASPTRGDSSKLATFLLLHYCRPGLRKRTRIRGERYGTWARTTTRPTTRSSAPRGTTCEPDGASTFVSPVLTDAASPMSPSSTTTPTLDASA